MRNSDRLSARIPARLFIDDDAPLDLLVTDLSRGGCRVGPTAILPAARQIRIEVTGWPVLTGRTVWSRDGATGCIFDPKPSEARYAEMAGLADGAASD